MTAAPEGAPPGGPDRVRAERFGLLAGVRAGQGDVEVLTQALLHVTAELGGLGGMAHTLVQEIERGLLLVVATGLPPDFLRGWTNVSGESAVAPVRAIQEDAYAFLPDLGRPRLIYGRKPDEPEPAVLPAGAGMAAAPLPGPEGPLGVLSVVLPVSRVPDRGQRAFLQEVARRAGGLLRLAPAGPAGVSPTLLQERGAPAAPEAGQSAPWEWDLRTGSVRKDRRFLEAFGIDRRALDGTLESWGHAMHPEDVPWTTAEMDRALSSRGTFDFEHRMRRADGTYGWIRVQGRVVTDERGEPARVVGTAWNTTQSHAALESVGRALLHMSDGFLSVSGDGRIGFVNAAAERLLGASREMVGRLLWEAPALRDVPGVEERYREAVDRGAPVSFDVPGQGAEQWYGLRLVPIPDGLTVYVTDISERRRREAAERSAAERAALMAGLTRALAESVTSDEVVAAVAGSVLPPFGASGLIVAQLKQDRLHVVGSTGYPRALLDRIHGTPLRAAVARDALRTGTPEFFSSPDEVTARHPEAADLIPGGGKQAGTFLPLIASGRPFGVCVIAFDEPHPFVEDERTVLTALSGLIAQALERAGLYDSATARARELQRVLLPRVLPSLPALTAAARYRPAARGADIGGDWYDLIPLSADRVALVIGDVMGHGLPEAAIMGRLRTAVRTLSDLELPPDDVLARVNDLVADLGEESFTTCLYGVYDPTSRELLYANAGHLPPTVVHPDGTVTPLDRPPDPPLGVAAPPFALHRLVLPGGSLLALYTDGLVERPGHAIDDGMNHLAAILAAALRDSRDGAPEPDALCEAVTAALLPDEQPTPDDAALLIARTHALSEEAMAHWPLPEDPTAAARAREHIRAQLAAWDLEELEMTTELIVSELVGNVIRHASGPVHLRMLRSRTLICEVADASLTTPHIRHPSAMEESGRGLQLVAAMAERWGTRYTGDGKVIWTEQSIPAIALP
ncbi:SpoIIE family protein phosphatase [Streptomyces sp. DSM 44917]|uniref:SpoIIE family protein phosphatase n=1 Tax=Streptomyces boetiae TaxID=3075541 RepID=A0ABU2L1Z6_9ACTN|nr:SpoIIE family protein phosphatase [Streptomyces sp. DSM 44917]MDT0305532.1 SpoIIE family protein phosphatase [Streptomyces sp. DSM 44917]